MFRIRFINSTSWCNGQKMLWKSATVEEHFVARNIAWTLHEVKRFDHKNDRYRKKCNASNFFVSGFDSAPQIVRILSTARALLHAFQEQAANLLLKTARSDHMDTRCSDLKKYQSLLTAQEEEDWRSKLMSSQMKKNESARQRYMVHFNLSVFKFETCFWSFDLNFLM